MIDPKDIAARIPVCPMCQTAHYAMEMSPGLPPKVKALRCAKCGADILRAYRRLQPVAFGLTLDAIDRLLIATGAALVVALALSLTFG